MIIVIFSNQYWGLEWLKYAICLVTKVVENELDFYGNRSYVIRIAVCNIITRGDPESQQRFVTALAVWPSQSHHHLWVSLSLWNDGVFVNCHVNWGLNTIKKCNSQAILLIQLKLTDLNRGEGLSEGESPELQNRFEEWQFHFLKSIL